MSFELILALVGFLIVAFVYSSAGFGGGSSYLAILSLIPSAGFCTIRTTALICNIVVVGGSILAWSFRNKWSKEWVLKNGKILIVSIPLAYVAGSYKISESTFFVLLGLTLLISAFTLFFISQKINKHELNNGKPGKGMDSFVGGVLGGMAGLVGIGGGIFLSPYLYFRSWDNARRISIATSLFILFNSIAGLSGQVINQSYSINWGWTIPLALAVLVGGQLGIRLNMSVLNEKVIKNTTAFLILIAGINVLIRELWN